MLPVAIRVPCPSSLTYNFDLVARSWGSFAGILAGFAFAATIQTLTRPSRRKLADAHVIEVLVCAFLGLLLSAIVYAVLNGETAAAMLHGRGTAEEYLAGLTLGLSALLLLYAVVVMIDSRRLSRVAVRVRWTIGILIPAMVTLQVSLGGEDNIFGEIAGRVADRIAKTPGPVYRCPKGDYYAYLHWGVWAPFIVVLLLSVLIMALRKDLAHRTVVLRTRTVVPYLALTAIVVATIAFSSLDEFNDGFRLPHYSLYLISWVTATFAALTTIGLVADPAWVDDHAKGTRQRGLRPASTPAQRVGSRRLLRQRILRSD